MRYETLVLFGPPGAGKGTAGASVASFLSGVHYAATGDMVRSITGAETHPLKAKILSYITNGLLIPDDTICDVFRSYLDTAKVDKRKTLLIDGIPRTIEQGVNLGPILDIKAILHFTNLPNKELLMRMLGRAEDAFRAGKTPRPDDTPKAIKKRIKDYYTQSYPTLDLYSDMGVPIIPINGLLPKEEMKVSLLEEITNLLHHP